VHLVACSQCETQYDATDVVGEKFRCRCGAMVANPSGASVVDVQIERCGSCGARILQQADRCEFCYSEVLRDVEKLSRICPECHCRNGEASRFCTACGAGFAPVSAQSEAFELPCPVCGVLMPPRNVGGIGINECGRCNGIWAPEDHLDQLIQRALDAGRKEGESRAVEVAPRVVGANPARQPVAYRKCPVCEAFMQRRNFRRTSGVIVDCCQKHGTWLEADELEQVTGYVLAAGDPAENSRAGSSKRTTGLAAAGTRTFSSLFEAILD